MSTVTPASKIAISKWTLCLQRNTLLRDNTEVRLESRQSQLLEYLARHADQNVSKAEILQNVWGNRIVNEDALYVCVTNLRKALGDNPHSPSYIKTIPGYGYRMVSPVSFITADENTNRQHSASKWNSHGWRWLTIALLLSASMLAYFYIPNKNDSESVPVTIKEDFMRARYLLSSNSDSGAIAEDLLYRVIAIEPNFAPAYVLLGESKFKATFNSTDPKIHAETKGLIATALKLRPNDQHANFVQANIAFFWDWDFATADLHYQKALGFKDVENYYAQFLLAKGEFELAHKFTQQYIEKNPEGYSHTSVAWIYFMSGDIEKALATLGKLANLIPDDFYYRVSLQSIYEYQGLETKAGEQLLWLMQHAGYDQAILEEQKKRLANEGLKAVYRWLAFEDTQHLNIGQYQPPLSLARYAIAAGEKEHAIQFLTQSAEKRQYELLWLLVYPKFQSLRQTPEFQAILKSIDLHQFQKS